MTTKFDFSSAPNFAKSDKTSIFAWDGAPLQYRFSGSSGQFFTGGSSEGFFDLQMQILDWRWVCETRFNNVEQYWLDVLFADANHAIAILPLKKESAEAMSAFLKGLSSGDRDIHPHSIALTLKGTKRIRQVPDGDREYYVADRFDWNWVSAQQFGDAAEWIAHEMPENPWILTGVVDRG